MMGHLGTALGHFIPVHFGSMVPIDNDKPNFMRLKFLGHKGVN